MSNELKKIKYSTGRDGQYDEFKLNNTTLILPDGSEYSIRYDHVNKGLEVVKCWGAIGEDNSITIQPGTANKILIK